MPAWVRVRGASEHNLRGVDVDLPLGGITAFVGPSGSGKSSLAFDTLHAEGRRRYLDALALHGPRATRGLRRPDVVEVEGLPPTIALDQRASAPASTETVGGLTETEDVLAALFGRAGVQHCPRCGRVVRAQTHDEIVAELLALPAGGRLLLEAPLRASSLAGALEEVARAGFSRVRVGDEVVRVEEVDPSRSKGPIRVVVDRLKIAPDRRPRIHEAVRTASQAGGGVLVAVTDDGERTFTDRPWCHHDGLELPPLSPRSFRLETAEAMCSECRGTGLRDGVACPACEGERYGPAARAVRWGGHRLPELLGLGLPELRAALLAGPPGPVAEVAVQDVVRRINQLVRLGLAHLGLGSRVSTLSRGELQRVRLARQVGAALSGVLYVLDEPTSTLGPAEAEAVAGVLRDLVAQGNTVLVVSHHPVLVAAADHVVEFGPGAGTRGGQVVFAGTPAAMRQVDTASARWLFGGARLERRPVAPSGWVRAEGLRAGNLAGDPVRMPVGGLAAIVGPSGSGKSQLLEALGGLVEARFDRVGGGSLAVEGLGQLVRVVHASAAAARSTRSTPATWTGVWEVMRTLFASTQEAQVRGLEARHFSLNVKAGRCEACAGTGERRIELDLLPDVWIPCPVCGGRRFGADILEVRWKGRSAFEILELRAEEAHVLLAGHPKLEASLRALIDVGLGYLPLGQPLHTLSGGEAHRLALARELARADRQGIEGTLYLLDDPTLGLHPTDGASLLAVLSRLVERGGTVWMATHDLGLAAVADHLVELGPGPGPQGGRVLRQGAPLTRS